MVQSSPAMPKRELVAGDGPVPRGEEVGLCRPAGWAAASASRKMPTKTTSSDDEDAGAAGQAAEDPVAASG